MHRARYRRMLQDLLEAPAELDPVQAALYVAAEDDPAAQPNDVRAKIQAIAREAGERAAGDANPFRRLHAVHEWLFDDLGLRGESGSYHDPESSFLHRVLERRRGIPLSLTLLLLEAARAAGFSGRVVALPGRAVARLEFDGRTLWVDAADRGRLLTPEDCRDLVARSSGRPGLFRPELLLGAPAREVVARMLLNLKRAYLAREDFPGALSAVERLLLVRPEDAREIRDRGILLGHLGDAGRAASELARYLELEPAAPDAAAVRSRLDRLRRRVAAAERAEPGRFV